MRLGLKISLFLVIFITILLALFTQLFTPGKLLILTTMSLMYIKFLLVAFSFMDIRKAHIGWKILVSGFALVFYITVFSLAV